MTFELIGAVVILVAAYVGLPLALRWLLRGRHDATSHDGN